jgi:hypothetical protein
MVKARATPASALRAERARRCWLNRDHEERLARTAAARAAIADRAPELRRKGGEVYKQRFLAMSEEERLAIVNRLQLAGYRARAQRKRHPEPQLYRDGRLFADEMVPRLTINGPMDGDMVEDVVAFLVARARGRARARGNAEPKLGEQRRRLSDGALFVSISVASEPEAQPAKPPEPPRPAGWEERQRRGRAVWAAMRQIKPAGEAS